MKWLTKDRLITAAITSAVWLLAFGLYSLLGIYFHNTALSGTNSLKPNNTFAQATLISAGDETSGAFTPSNGVDTYKFNITQPSNVTVEYLHLPPGIELQLYDPDYKLLGQSISLKGLISRRVEYPLIKTGYYYIRLIVAGDETTPYPYSMNLSIKPIK